MTQNGNQNDSAAEKFGEVVDQPADDQLSLFGAPADAAAATGVVASADPTPADTPAARAAQLNALLAKAAYAYYALDAPEITDAEFDRMLVELQSIEAAHPELVTPDSYTQRVGGYVSEQFEPVRHAQRMYSIDDAMNLEELDEWLARTEEALGGGATQPISYTCELKIDGLGIALTYPWRRHHRRKRHRQRPDHPRHPAHPGARRHGARGRRRLRPRRRGPRRGLHAAPQLRSP